jgi:proteasome beta subunit
MRGIYPVVSVVSAAGYRRLPDAEVGEVVGRLVAARSERPDGPAAPLT